MGKVQEIRESEKGQKIVQKGKNGIFHIIFGRTGIIFLLLLIQLGILFVVFGKLQEYAVYAYWAFGLLSAITVIVIINRPGNPGFKLAWMVPLTLIPVFGVLMYIFVEMQVGVRIMNKKLNDTSRKIRKYQVQEPQVTEQLNRQDRQMGNLSRYIYTKGGFPTYQNSSVKYFPLGEDKFKTLVEELEKAEKFIFMEYFIVAEGRMWDTIRDILARKVKEGVEVRFMYDGTCTVSLLPHNYPEKLQSMGIQCKVFNSIKPALSTTQNNRDHRKIVVIDGHTAFTGGVNLADEYINEKERFGHWKDTAVMVKGEAVRSFTWMFLQLWDIEVKEEDFGKYLNVKQPAIASDGYVIPYGDSPLDKENVGELVYMDILNTAKDYVHIMTPYYPELIRAGVKIYQYVPGFVHAKVFTSDDTKAVVGTINLDYRSLYLHFECAAMMYQVKEVEKIEEDFQDTLKQCREITLETLKKEKFWTKIYGRFLRLFAPLM